MQNHSTTNATESRPGLVYILNSSIALGFVRGQLEYFQSRGFDVTVIYPPRRSDEWSISLPEGIRAREISMERTISPFRDLRSLWHLWTAIRALRPAITNVGTPKAGLLGGLAAWLCRVPCRFYTLHGLRFETTHGALRRFLIFAEKLACAFAHRVICVSPSTRENAIASGLVTREQTIVLGSGSCNGVDVSRFAPTPDVAMRADVLRCQLTIPDSAKVILYVGRLTRDKGIPELFEAFAKLDKRFPDLRMVLAGCYEDGDPLSQETKTNLETHPHIILAGAVEDTPAYYALADFVVLPSHREGLPTVVLEAQAACKPVVGARANGIIDVVTHGKTGLLFPVGNVPALAAALAKLIANQELAHALATCGEAQVARKFRQEHIWQALYREYFRVLRAHGLASPLAPGSRTSTSLRVRPSE